MPPAVIGFLATPLVGALGEGLAVAVVTTLLKTAAAAALGYASNQYEKKQAKNAYKNRAVILEANIRSAAQPQVVIYGQTVVGSLVNYATTGRLSGTKDDYDFWVFDTLAGHECEDVVDLYYDNNVITDAAHINWGLNAVTGGTYGISGSGGRYALHVYKQLGTSTQTVISDADAALADIDSNFRGRGICYVAQWMRIWSQTKGMWESQGAPSTRRFLVKGKRSIYDPRLDTSPGANPTSPSYMAYTDNPILCVANCLVDYGGVSTSRIDWSSVADEADICDTLVNIPGPSTQKRYTLNGAFTLGSSISEILESMLTSCMGRLVKVSGKWRILAGAYRNPSVTLTEADIVGAVTEVTRDSVSERFNSVRGTYINASENYQETTFLPVSVAAYVTDDGQTLYKDISLPFTTSEYISQRIAYKHALQSRNQLTLTLPVRWTGLKVTPGTTVALTYGPYSGKIFRCVNWKMGTDDAPFELVLREESEASWADLAAASYSTRSTAGVVTKGSYLPSTAIPALQSNVLPQGYSDHEEISLDWYAGVDSGTVSLDTTYKYIGSRSLKVTGVTTNAASWGCGLYRSTYTEGNLYIPAGRRWLVKAAVRPNQYCSDQTIRAVLDPDSGSNINSNYIDLGTTDTWGLIAWELDASASTATQFVLRFETTNSSARGGTPIYWIDAIELVDVTNLPLTTETDYSDEYMPGTGPTPEATKASTKIKLSDTSRSSTTTLTDDPELFGWTMEAGKTYSIECYLLLSQSSAGDFKFQYQFSQTAQYCKGFKIAYGDGGSEPYVQLIDPDSAAVDVYVAGDGAGLWVVSSVIWNASNNGTFDFQWAQRASSATATILKKSSFVRVREIG